MKALALSLSLFAAAWGVSVPSARAQAGPTRGPEVLREVRVHGNHTTPDAEVLRIAGLAIDQPLLPPDLAAALTRLRGSGRFDDVEFRKRSRSLDDTGDVALIILVREHPVPDEVIATTPAPLRPFRRLMASGMFLPVFGYSDGYGFTYGARFTFADTLGRGGRLSVPLTWGGTKRVALEADRPLSRGPFDRLTASASIWSRENPYFELDEDRRELTVGASRAMGPVRVGLLAGYARVGFGAPDETVGWYGATVALDTRSDPVFPRNAVYAETGWTALRPSGDNVNRYRADVRAYRGVFGQSVLCLRAQFDGADGRLPAFERPLLGGAGSVRGYRAGAFSGDNLAAGSIEVRVPVSSPMGIARAGFTVFGDVGRTWDHGDRFGDAPWRRGAGAGVFLLASVFQLNLEVGVRQGGGARVHFTTGVQF